MSDAHLDETHYDVIIVGTGMVESMLGGALSRAGKKVLQLDQNDYYGGQYRTLSLPELNSLFQSKNNKMTNGNEEENSQKEEPKEEQKENDDNGEHVVNENKIKEELLGTTEQPLAFSDPYESVTEAMKHDEEYLKTRDARRFNIDLINKVIYSDVNLVPLLVKSSVGRYMEFKCIDAVMLYTKNAFQKVPCTKGEIMANSFISLIDKRYLGKFMTFCLNYETKEADQKIYEQYAQKPFIEFLRTYHKLSSQLEDFIVFTIAMLDSKDNNVTTEEGMKRIQRYIRSLGRYGNTAFLYPMYGISELNQAFCRVGAVYSGTYVLRRGIQSIFTTSSQDESVVTTNVKGVTCTTNQQLSCETLILNNDYRLLDNKADLNKCDRITRCVTLTDFAIIEGTGAYIAVIPPSTISDKQNTAITIVQLDYRSATSPQGKFIISFQMRSREGEHEDAQVILKACVQRFLHEKQEELNAQRQEEYRLAEEKRQAETLVQPTEKLNDNVQNEENASESPAPQQEEQQQQQNEATNEEAAQSRKTPEPVPASILYQLYYRQYVRHSTGDNAMSSFGNVFVCNDADIYLDMEDTVAEAKSIFYKMCSEEFDFIEKLPDPEETLDSQIFDEDARMLGVDQQIMQQMSNKDAVTQEKRE